MSAFQGFDRKLNLLENTADRDVLNNLGVAPIADDIALFTNNLRNTSELLVTIDKRFGNIIRFNPLSQRFMFTNGTKIKAFTGQDLIGDFFVGDSNNLNEFQLYADENLTQLVFPPAGVDVRYVRSDAILKEDIINLVKPRRPVVERQSASQITIQDSTADISDIADGITGVATPPNIYTSLRRVYSSFRDSVITITEYMNAIESNIDTFEQKKQKSIINNTDFLSEIKVTFTGNIIVTGQVAANAIVPLNSGPGIFILDPTTDIAKRAFSDNENVWTAEPPLPAAATDLVGATREIVVGNLVFNSGVRIIRKAAGPEIAPESNLANTFTHYVKVTVNGEEYSLCLK